MYLATLHKYYFSMDDKTDISIQTFIDQIFVHLTGFSCENQSIIRINNENLSIKGDLHFLSNLKLWKTFLTEKSDCNESCINILKHYAHTRNLKIEEMEETEINEKIFQSLISASNNLNLKIAKCVLQKERICLFLERPSIIKSIINTVIEKGPSFGRGEPKNEHISLTFYSDEKSELTTVRLRLIKDVCKKILDLQGYKVCKESRLGTIVLTSKSQEERSKECNRYVCGVVKNSKTNTKETTLTWNKYMNIKMEVIMELNEQKYFYTNRQDGNNEIFLRKMAEASIAFELLSIKPSRPVFINIHKEEGRSLTNTKGASFILYNTARIAAIIEKYNRGASSGEYPNLIEVKDVDFSLLNDEDEWELIYNFIVGYSKVIESSIRHKSVFQVCPQVICMFLSRLTQKFSIYYRRIKILTERYEHLHNQLIARIYMLKALQIILENALAILNIKSVSCM